MLKHDMLEVELGKDQETKKEDSETHGTPKSFLKHPTCTGLKNCFRFDLCLQLLRVTRQTGVVGKPTQKVGSLQGIDAQRRKKKETGRGSERREDYP